MSWILPSRATELRVLLALAVMILVSTSVMAARNPGLEESKAGTKNIHVLHVRGNVYMLVGAGCNITGCNITVQVGEQYVIVVDTGLPQFADEVIATIRQLTSLPIMFLGNTTSDGDHTGGNAKLFQARMGIT